MFGAAGFERDVDGGVAEADAVVGAVEEQFDDVGALAGDDRGEFGECAGAVRQVNADANQAAVFDQAALDDAAEQGDVDVATADDYRGVLAVEAGLLLQQRGYPGGA